MPMCISPFTGRTLCELEWNLLSPVLHSPDIAPWNYYLFSHRQPHLDYAIFYYAQATQNVVDLFLDSRPLGFLVEVLEKLPKQ